jgi:3-hydroxyisobutyrate dehydrogenase-like beta-hydroxyacid dehydrogenase
MSDVTVIGLGEMGSALAGAFLKAGRKITVWNRTEAKAASLVRQGAVFLPDIAAAVAASPVIVICLSDYTATRAVLTEKAAATLTSRQLVQLSTGTPKEARDLAAWANERGILYLDGAILAWPSQIGGRETVILIAGDNNNFTKQEKLLRELAGGLTWLGAESGAAASLFAAVLAYLAMAWIGFAHGARIAEAEKLDVKMFGNVIASIAPILGEDARHMGEVVADDDYADPESTLQTAGADVARLLQHAREAGINADVPSFAATIFKRAVDAGHGAEEHIALIKVLRG